MSVKRVAEDPIVGAVTTSTARRSVAGSSLIVMSGLGGSAVLGFALQVILARYYGTRIEMDVFLNASTVPTVLLGGLNIALATALTPTFSEYVSQGRIDQVKRFGSTVIATVFLLMSALTILGWFLAPTFVSVLARGFSHSEQLLDVQMVRWLMPSIIATGVSGVCSALLHSNHRFVPTALTFVTANVVTIAVVVALNRELGIFALVLGTLLGLFAQLLVQLTFIVRYDLCQYAFDLRHPGLANTWPLLLPSFVSSSAGQINLSFDRYFASTLNAGSTAAMGYTVKVANMPPQIVVTALGVVIFPLIAQQFATLDHAGMKRSIGLALRMINLLMIPCAAGLCALAYPIVQTLFERGAFGPPATALCASFIPFACVSLLASSYSLVTGRACSACKLNRKTAVISVAAVSLNVALSAGLVHVLGVRGLLLANGVALFFLVACHIKLLSGLVGGFEWQSLLSSTARVLICALVMVGTLSAIEASGIGNAMAHLGRGISLTVLISIGAIVYLSMARLFRIEELTFAANELKRRFSRRPLNAGR